MSYLNDGKAFRMPDSWYDPPEPDYWKCPECGAEEQAEDVCEDCNEPRPEMDEGPDPDDERDQMLDRQWEEEDRA